MVKGKGGGSREYEVGSMDFRVRGGDGSEGRDPEKGGKRGLKTRTTRKGTDASVVRFCPVCLEEGVQTRLSAGSVGCVKHWREVKRRNASS